METLKIILDSSAVTGVIASFIPSLALAGIVWVLRRKPSWLVVYNKYQGYVFQAIELAEKVILINPENKHLAKFGVALDRMKKIFADLNGRLPTPSEICDLEQAIEYGHAEMERVGILGAKGQETKKAA